MKILVYAGNGGSGGLKGYIKGFLSACNVVPENEVVVLCNQEYSEYIEDSIANNVRIRICNGCTMHLSSYLKGNKLSSDAKVIIDQENPDIVYFMNSIIHKGAEKYVNVVGMHNQLYIDKKQLCRQKVGKTLISLYIQRHFALKSLKKADAVVLDSSQSLQQCIENKIKLAKPIVAYFGVEDNERCDSVRTIDVSNPVELLYVSTIFPYKNQIDLIWGVAELKKRGYKIKLHLVGSGPKEYTEQLKEKIIELGLDNEIVMYSWVDHSKVKQMIDETDIFVYASSIETSGFGLMEGMVRGAVIACNNESCMPEILGGGGLLFDVHNPTNTADIIERLINGTSLRAELSKKALKVSSKYTWENHARIIFDNFSQLLNFEKG